MAEIRLATEIQEIKNQFSYSKNIGFFLGAGASCALGLPDIRKLTDAVEDALDPEDKNNFEKIKTDISDDGDANIEDILNQIRRIREITGEKASKSYNNVDGDSAKKLDLAICHLIYDQILEKELIADLSKPKKLLAWLSKQNRDFTKEIFTINYDQIIERSLENMRIPYFDGFVGAYEPFFWQESIDKVVDINDITRNWLRLWKLHGSLGWFWKEGSKDVKEKIIRIGRSLDAKKRNNELVIYPSREKYDASRKQPFIAYFDRLKAYLQAGELLFIVTGYSFSDQHINEIIFDSLRQNSRLTVIAFIYGKNTYEDLPDISSYPNLSVFSPDKGSINVNEGKWAIEESELEKIDKWELFWDNDEKKLLLGDFGSLVDFLASSSGSTAEMKLDNNE